MSTTGVSEDELLSPPPTLPAIAIPPPTTTAPIPIIAIVDNPVFVSVEPVSLVDLFTELEPGIASDVVALVASAYLGRLEKLFACAIEFCNA